MILFSININKILRERKRGECYNTIILFVDLFIESILDVSYHIFSKENESFSFRDMHET